MSFNDFVSARVQGDISRYVEYKAAQWDCSIDEAARRSLGRLFTQTQESDRPIVIITAFRSERPLAANRDLNRQLANDLRTLGWGYTPVLGGFMEKVQDPQGGQKEVRVHDESFFATATGDPQQVIGHTLELLQRYQQEAAIVKLPGQDQAFLLSANGQQTPVGAWHADPKLMATYYTRMRHGPAKRQFSFEAAGDDSRTTRMAVDAYFRNFRNKG